MLRLSVAIAVIVSAHAAQAGSPASVDAPRRQGDRSRFALARAEFERGEKLYAARRFEAAAGAYLTAYDLSGMPELVFNVAQAYRLAGEPELAAQLYWDVIELMPDHELSDAARDQVARLVR